MPMVTLDAWEVWGGKCKVGGMECKVWGGRVMGSVGWESDGESGVRRRCGVGGVGWEVWSGRCGV